MNRQKIQLQPAFILHRRDYRNSSLLLEIFSKENGRLCLVGKGVRRAQNKNRPYLQAFQALYLSWVISGDLGQLTGVEPALPPFHLQRQALYSAFYLNELILRLLTRHDPHPQVYEKYQASLKALVASTSVESILRIFEKNLLADLGYGLALNRDHQGMAINPDAEYVYFVEQGPVLMHTFRRTGDVVSIKGDTLLCFDRDELPGHHKLMAELKTLMRYVLKHYLGENSLKTRVLFQHSSVS